MSGGPRSFLFITHVGDPGGAEFTMIPICQALGAQAEVLLLEHGSLERILTQHGIAHRVDPLGAAAGSVRRAGGLASLLGAVPASLRMARRMARAARRVDVVVCFSLKSFVLATMAKPFTRRPIVWFMNDILSTDHFSRVAMWLLVALSWIGADRVALCSQESLRAWRTAGGRRRGVSVVHSGIDLAQVARQLANPQRIHECRESLRGSRRALVGMFGRLSPWKGQDVFLRALAEVPGAQGIIVGGALSADQAYRCELEALAHSLGVAERVKFIGHVDEPLMYMAACDVVAHCSTAPEPWGRVIVEAMLAGTPVVATNAGGVPEFVRPGETGQLTPLSDHRALAAALNRYLADPEWSRGIAARARSFAEQNFSTATTWSGFQRAVAEL